MAGSGKRGGVGVGRSRLAGVVGDRTLEERLAAHIARKVSVWLALEVPETVDGVESWRAALHSVQASI